MAIFYFGHALDVGASQKEITEWVSRYRKFTNQSHIAVIETKEFHADTFISKEIDVWKLQKDIEKYININRDRNIVHFLNSWMTQENKGFVMSPAEVRVKRSGYIGKDSVEIEFINYFIILDKEMPI